MAFAAFDLNDDVTFLTVVFARDREHALCLGNEHRTSMRFGGTSQITCMERLPPLGGAARNHHLVAIAAGVPGVGYQQSDGSWLILPAGARPSDAIQPHPTRRFNFSDDDGYEVVLFAHDQMRAGELYEAILTSYRILPREWQGDEWETWSTIGLVRHQAQAEGRGVEGIGVYNSHGWLVLPLDYDALGVAPPD